MTYLRRAVKYFLQITLLFAVIIGVLMLTGYVSKDVAVAFKNGWNSIWLILGLFLVMSAVYPFFGYNKRDIRATGEPSSYKGLMEEALKLRGYKLTEEKEDGTLLFRLSSPLNRAARFWEDTITITPQLGGFRAEGLVRDLVRVVAAINYKINEDGK